MSRYAAPATSLFESYERPNACSQAGVNHAWTVSDPIKGQGHCRTSRTATRFFKRSSGIAAGVAGGAILAACGGNSNDSVAQPASGPSDADILNFALNLEHLEAQFYIVAATGAPLPANLLTGTEIKDQCPEVEK